MQTSLNGIEAIYIVLRRHSTSDGHCPVYYDYVRCALTYDVLLYRFRLHACSASKK